MQRLIPFFFNTANDLRCAQAVMRMILAAEGVTVSFSQLDRVTRRTANQWTWNPAIMQAMKTHWGFSGILIEPFNYQKFGDHPEKYMRWYFGGRQAEVETQHTNIVVQARLAKTIDRYCQFKKKSASLQDLKQYFNRGWYVVPTVNSARLHGYRGLVNHVVLVTAVTRTHITIHDPGLPARANWRLPWSSFRRAFTGTLKAWSPIRTMTTKIPVST